MDGEWLKVEPEFADFYMTLLANRLAQRKGFGLLTSSFAADRLANTARRGGRVWGAHPEEYGAERGSMPRSLVEGTVVDLVLGGLAVSPTVPLEALLKFRTTHSDELGRLRAKLGELASAIPNEQSFEAARQHARDIVENEVKPSLGDLRAALAGQRIRSMSGGLLKVSFLSAAPTSALVVAGLSVPTAILVGAGISLIVAGALFSEGRRWLRRENPFSYLLSVEDKFA
jgi:hypothetical protein